MSMSLLRRGRLSVRRAARRLGWLVADLLPVRRRAPELTIDPRRLNDELRRSVRVGPDDDVIYRERVKQRMRDGARCPHPPLFQRRPRRPLGMLPVGSWRGLPATTGRSPRALQDWYGL
jgi:hypothetical protein